jgi:DNA-directed RNA polymerase specialized sigma24 family protein
MANINRLATRSSGRGTMWELNQHAFDLLLAHLATDPDQAGERYEQLRRTLLFFFECHGCSTADEQADQTIDRVSKRLASNENIEDLFRYSYGAARHVLQEYWKRSSRKRQHLEEMAPSREPSTDFRQMDAQRQEMETQEQWLACMRGCLQSLPPEDRELVTQYTLNRRQRTLLAEQRRQTLNGLRLQVFHIRERLRGCEEKYHSLRQAGVRSEFRGGSEAEQ